MERLHYLKNKRIPLLIMMAAIIAVIVVIFIILGQRAPDPEEPEYQMATVSRVHMTQTITASGKVQAGETTKVFFDKGKTFRAMAADKDELVRKGQSLVYYTNGTHTDAPITGIVRTIRAPKSGAATGDAYYVTMDNTQNLYLNVMIPEDKINVVAKGDPADIVINAYADREYTGKILSIQGVSSKMKSEESQSDEESEDGSAEDDTGDESGADSDADTGEGDDYEDEDYESEAEDYSEDGESEGTAYYAINIAFENDGDLRPGMSASVVITISDRDDVLAVPVQAVRFDRKNRPYVERVDGKDITKVSVETGESDPVNVEIKKGLTEGDQIRVIR